MKRLKYWGLGLKLAVMAAIIISVTPALAGAEDGKDRGVGFEAIYMFPTQLDGDEGEFSVYRTKAFASWGPVRFSYDRRWYDWKTSELHKVPFGDGRHAPWKNLHHLELTGLWNLRAWEKWNFKVEAGASASFEKQFGGPGGILGFTAGYAISPTVSLRAGGWAHVHEHRFFFIPDVGLDFNHGVDRGVSASIGLPDTWVSYRFNKQMAVRLFAALDRGYYKLSDQSTVAEEGYLHRIGYQTGLMFSWTPSEHVEVSAGAVYAVATNWKLYDRDGEEFDDYDVDSGLGGVLMMSFSF